jgi:molecular chaperone GrpE (heat shock protein)
MASKDSGDDTDKMLSAMDFGKMMDVAGALAAQNEKHRKETAGLLLGFLEVVDSIEALGAHCQELVEQGYEHVPLRSVNTTYRQALNILSRLGVEQMNAAGRPLNLEEHEVEAVRPNTSAEEDTVLEEKLRGYLWNGTLLRRAKVVVAQ